MLQVGEQNTIENTDAREEAKGKAGDNTERRADEGGGENETRRDGKVQFDCWTES